ncbi:MAG TPA: response regulator transcription factor [Solirubrobacterales bacterium]|nr:response regulator transcription factor [Solirubrobacterales bacterium]
MGSERPHCLVIDGHPLVRAGVRETLSGSFEVHESERRDEAVDLVRDVGSIDVAIVDMRRAPGGAAEVLRADETIRLLRTTAPGLGIVAHGERPERHMATAALQAGASAYVARTAAAEALLKAVRAALADERFVDPAVPPRGSRGKLTRRQRQILQLLADGQSSAFAARELGLSEETIKTHTRNALARLGARNRTHAVAIALRESLIE